MYKRETRKPCRRKIATSSHRFSAPLRPRLELETGLERPRATVGAGKKFKSPFFPTSSHVCVSIGRAEGAAAPPEQQRLPPPAVGERRQRPQQRRRLSAAAAAGESRGHATKSRRREKRTDGRTERKDPLTLLQRSFVSFLFE